jgi:hypothetical protein
VADRSGYGAGQIVFMDSTKGISTITAVSSPQIPSSPTAFLGHTLQEILDWFDENITQPRSKGYRHDCFLVFDDETVEDDSWICVSTLDSVSGEMQSARFTFYTIWHVIVTHF